MARVLPRASLDGLSILLCVCTYSLMQLFVFTAVAVGNHSPTLSHSHAPAGAAAAAAAAGAAGAAGAVGGDVSFLPLATPFHPIKVQVGFLGRLTLSNQLPPWERSFPNNPNITLDPNGMERLNLFLFAVNDVNNNPKYNKWFKITYDLYDDQAFPARGFFGALDLIENTGARILCGPATSSATVNTHVVSTKYNVPILGYAASSPDLSNKKLYPNFFRTDQSDSFQAVTMAWLAAYQFNWPRVATLSTQDSYGAAGVNAFAQNARKLGVSVVTAQTIPLVVEPAKLDGPLTALKDSGAKIIIYFGQTSEFLTVMTRAGEFDLLKDDMVWLLSDETVSDIYPRLYNMSGFLGVAPDPGFGSPVLESFIDKFLARPSDTNNFMGLDNFMPRSRDINHYSFFAADTAYLIGEVLYDLLVLHPLGLNKSSPLPDESVILQSVQKMVNFTQKELFAALRRADYDGITGKIKFDENQDRGDLRFQLANVQLTKPPTTDDPFGSPHFGAVGVWQSNTFKFKDNKTVIWRDGTTNIPLAAPVGIVSGTGSLPPSATLSDTALGILQAACVLMIVIVLSLIFFVMWARTSRVIHASSPKMMLVMLCGILCVLGAALANNVEQSKGSCTAKLWLFNIGFTAAFGSLFLKTFRVWKIFSNERLMVSALTDIQLLQLLCVFLSYDVILLIIHSSLSPYRMELYSHRCVFASGDEKVSQALTILLTLGKGLMVCGGAILTVKTKDLPSLYNETTYIALLIYNVGVVSAIYLAIRYGISLSGKPSSITIIETIFMLVCCALACVILFFPKVKTYWEFDHKMHVVKMAQAKRTASSLQLPRGSVTSNPSSLQGNKRANGASVSQLNKGAAATGDSGKPRSKTEIQQALDQFLQEQERALTSTLTDITSLTKKLNEQKERVNQLTNIIFQVQMEKEYFEQIGGDLQLDELNKIFQDRMSRLTESSNSVAAHAISQAPVNIGSGANRRSSVSGAVTAVGLPAITVACTSTTVQLGTSSPKARKVSLTANANTASSSTTSGSPGAVAAPPQATATKNMPSLATNTEQSVVPVSTKQNSLPKNQTFTYKNSNPNKINTSDGIGNSATQPADKTGNHSSSSGSPSRTPPSNSQTNPGSHPSAVSAAPIHPSSPDSTQMLAQWQHALAATPITSAAQTPATISPLFLPIIPHTNQPPPQIASSSLQISPVVVSSAVSSPVPVSETQTASVYSTSSAQKPRRAASPRTVRVHLG